MTFWQENVCSQFGSGVFQHKNTASGVQMGARNTNNNLKTRKHTEHIGEQNCLSIQG